MEKTKDKKEIVKITYKLVKKSQNSKTKTGKLSIQISKSKSPLKQTAEDEADDDDDDDVPLIKMNIKAKSNKPAVYNDADIAVVQPRKALTRKKISLDGEQSEQINLKPVVEVPQTKIKPFYCKICFIKVADDTEALKHERCHDTFRKPDGRWTCVICSDQFPFYCDLLNHFLNHRDVLELYSVYLSNLDTSLDADQQDAYSDGECEEFESSVKKEIEDLDSSDDNKDDINVESVSPSEGPAEEKNLPSSTIGKVAIEDSVNLNGIVIKTEPQDKDREQHVGTAFDFDESDPAAFFKQVSEGMKLEAEDFPVKKEILDEEDNIDYEGDFDDIDGFNDSDENVPLSSCIPKKKNKKKKKKKKRDNNEFMNGTVRKKSKKMKNKSDGDDGIVDDEQQSMEVVRDHKVPYSKLYKMQKCEQCDFESSKKAEMEMHSAEHVVGEPILCESCDFRCKIEKQLVRHKRLVHEGYSFACDSCDFTSKTIANLRGHMVVHGDRKIGCNLCGKMFRRKNNLNDHLKTHTNDRPFKCSECSKTFKDPKGYKMHLLGAHNIIQRLTCDYCNYETDHRHELNMHKASLRHSLYMRLAPAKNNKGEPIGESIIYACNVCDYIANTEPNLRSHLIVHSEKRISCEVCGKLFRRLGNLLEHQRSHNENRPYVCPVCPAKAFKDNKSYRRHIARQHDMMEMIKCELCDYKTHTQAMMRFHVMKHNGQLRYKCNECSFACMTRKTMQRHNLVHKDVYPVYNCELCDFQSISDRALKRHKQVHAEK